MKVLVLSVGLNDDSVGSIRGAISALRYKLREISSDPKDYAPALFDLPDDAKRYRVLVKDASAEA